MNSFAKRPYEISLWDEQLIWERRKLEQVEGLEEGKYTPGEYYSQNSEAIGEVPYTLDFGEYTDGRAYYILSSKEGDFIRGESSSDVRSPEDWGDAPSVVNSYYKEYKLCTIGSDTMEAPFRAVNGKFTTKINGENTLNFSVYYKYMDLDSGQLQINPFLPYLSNERKVKLRIGAIGSPDCKWYDLIIKQVQENSETGAFQYTCKDLFVNELSKSGFELEFDNELENNMGTVTYLGDNILEGSDWRTGNGSSVLHQYVEEPLYNVKLAKDRTIVATDMLTNETREISGTEESQPTILVFYSYINEQQANLQFLYDPREKYETDDNLIIDKDYHSNYIIKEVKFTEGRPEWAQSCVLSETYRGMRLVRQAQSKYDSTIDKYVSVYEKKNEKEDWETYYGFTKDKYLSPQAVFNYIVNPNSFTSTDGWVAESVKGERSTLSVVTYPPLGTIVNEDENKNELWEDRLKESKTYLAYQNVPGAYIMNTSISNYRSAIGSLKKGDRWVVRLKDKIDYIGGPDGPNDQGSYNTAPPEVVLAQYTLEEDGSFNFTKTLARFYSNNDLEKLVPNDVNEDGEVFEPENNPKKINYIYLLGSIFEDVSEEDMQDYNNRFGLFIGRMFATNDYFIEDIELFPLVTYTKENEKYLCVPGGEFFSETRTDYYYYKPNKNIKDIKELTYESVSEGKPDESFTQVYNDGKYTKVRSITGKESNRFNLLQDLCEKFECWIQYDVKRNEETGEILLGMDCNQMSGSEAYRQQKFIVFKEYLRDEYNWAGFRYGINEKSIQRTVDSNQIVSKMIVKDNANEFATDGFCSIARADDNDTKENFLLNFDHYYQHRLLNLATVTNDLYSNNNGYIGYYKLLREKNATRDALIEEQANLLIDLAHYDSMVQTYGGLYQSAIEEKQNIEIYVQQLTGSSFKAIADGFQWMVVNRGGVWGGNFNPNTVYYEANQTTGEYYRTEDASARDGKFYATNELYAKWDNNKEFLSLWAKYCQASNVITQYGPIYKKAEKQLDEVQKKYDAIVTQLDKLSTEKRALNLLFYKKYCRFLQEGSWISEDYVDDNLYYLDAKSTLHASAHPKVTYNINVLELSQLPGYENYKFELGDRTYIEDPEFFGYSLKDGVTPYREEIVVNEISIELDAPEKNSIKVQNYKNQFDDLFSRITASTQQLEYHSGGYQRAANVVEGDGTIAADSLEKSFQKNAISLSSAKDQSVVIDSYGITTSSPSKPDQLVRIISGGIYISNDGGQTWRTGITGAGISASVLTAGQLNTKDILIASGDFPSFRWNSQGINAFYINLDDGAYDPTRFVRFDQYGIYGLNGTVYHRFNVTEENEKGLRGEERIWDEAQYALTWKGFMLKRKGSDGGQVVISSEDDITVLAPKSELDKTLVKRIQIGDIGTDGNPVYGIRIANAKGESVMETKDDGTLWLKQQLNVEAYGANNKVAIGKLDTEQTKDSEHGGRVIDANGQFVVYEDGHMKATGATFSGDIEAENTTIGGIEVSKVIGVVDNVDTMKKLDLSAKFGYNFKVGDSGVSPEYLEFTVVGRGITLDENDEFRWSLTRDFTEDGTFEFDTTEKTIQVSYEQFEAYSLSNVAYLQVKNVDPDNDYETMVQIMAIKDGDKGEGGNSIVIEKIEYAKGDNNKDVPVSGWYDTIAEVNVPKGSYLWTRTTLNSGDGSSSVSYSTTYIPKDGGAYIISSNYEDVCVFYTEDGYKVSPETLKFQVYEENTPCSLNANSVLVQYKIDEEEWAEVKSENLNFSSPENPVTCEVNITSLASKLSEDALNDNAITLKFAYKIGEAVAAVKAIPIRWGIRSELAQFSVSATAINSLVRDAAMSFDAAGLTITSKAPTENSPKVGLTIQREVGDGLTEEVFYADDQGNLHLIGNIIANSGTFGGTLSSPEGEIGGFLISNDKFTSKDSENLVLFGGTEDESSYIKVKKIEIGEEASITRHIQLGSNAKICNPDQSNGIVLQSGALTLNNEGQIKLGNSIMLDSRDNKIDVGGIIIQNLNNDPKIYADNGSWSITKDRAVFSNIDVSGTINTTIFNIGSTQTVGSAMLFMLSYKILGHEYDGDRRRLTLYLDTTESNAAINAEDTVWLTKAEKYSAGEKYAEVKVISTGKKDDASSIYYNHGYIEVESEEEVTYFSVIPLGNTSAVKPMIMGINSNTTKDPSGYLLGQSLTMSTYGGKNNNDGIKPNLLLGNLSSLSGGKDGYGLYCDNVLLNGSLTTTIQSSPEKKTYAGINTVNGVQATQFDGADNSRVVFWAGASGEGAVNNAPFQVTEAGSLYAQNAKIENSIFSGDIRSATIHTAKIYGPSEKDDDGKIAALTLYDTSNGIWFNTSDDDTTLKLGVNGIEVMEKPVIIIGPEKKNPQVTVQGDVIQTPLAEGKGYLALSLQENGPALEHYQSEATKCGFYFGNGETTYKIQEKECLNLRQGSITLSEEIKFQSTNNLDDFRYQPVQNGYDLYIMGKT